MAILIPFVLNLRPKYSEMKKSIDDWHLGGDEKWNVRCEKALQDIHKYDGENGLRQNSFTWFATPFLENWWMLHVCQIKQNLLIVVHHFFILHVILLRLLSLPPFLNLVCFSSSLSFVCYSETAHCSEPANISLYLVTFSFYLSLASGILLPFMWSSTLFNSLSYVLIAILTFL